MMENLSFFSGILGAAVPFVIVLSVLVFFHELGHYLVARWNGVKVDVFSIGFGPELFGWTASSGTHWKVSAVPLGGYVKMFGDANEASSPDESIYACLSDEDKQKTLQSKTPLQKIAVVIAGPMANFVLAAVLLIIIFAFQGRINPEPVVGSVVIDSPAALAGLQAGDNILALNQQPIAKFADIQKYIKNSGGIPVHIDIEREGRVQSLLMTPESKTLDSGIAIGIIGIGPQILKTSFRAAIFYGIKGVYDMTAAIFTFLGEVVTSKENSGQLGSVLSIAKLSKDSMDKGFFVLLSFMAMLSVNLAVINLLPIPVLDGGHVLIHFIELIVGKPLSHRVQDILFKIGFGLLISVMLFTFYNDLRHFKVVSFFESLWQKLF